MGFGDILPFQSVPCTATVTNVIVPPTVDPTFIADKDTTPQNGVTKIDIRVKNFKNVVGVQFLLKYNTAELKFDSFFVHAPLTPVNPYPVLGNLSNNAATGTIAFAAWSSPDVLNGLTLPDGTVFFTASFKAIGPVGITSAVTFAGNPPTFPVEGYKGDGTPNSIAFVPGFQNGSVFITPVVVNPCNLSVSVDSIHNIKCKNGQDGEIFTSLVGSPTANAVYTWSGPTTNIPSMGDIGAKNSVNRSNPRVE